MRLLFIFSLATLVLMQACNKEEEKPEYPQTSRLERIPAGAVKVTPETDLFPPILHSDEWEEPVPLGPEVNTAGAEDSPFIPIDRDELYFFFTPDVNIPAEQQIYDEVTGIYISLNTPTFWDNATRVWLQDAGKLSLDGAQYVQGNNMLFVSAREGYTGLHWFSAEFVNDRWSHWQLADFDPSYDVGELHIHGSELYYHSSRSGGKGKLDVWKLTRINGVWQLPENIEAVNSAEDEGWPYISPDGQELWITRTYQGAAALFRSKKQQNVWQEPELIISQFAGEATLDKNGNLYFVHHFFDNGRMLEADIYMAQKK